MHGESNQEAIDPKRLGTRHRSSKFHGSTGQIGSSEISEICFTWKNHGKNTRSKRGETVASCSSGAVVPPAEARDAACCAC